MKYPASAVYPCFLGDAIQEIAPKPVDFPEKNQYI